MQISSDNLSTIIGAINKALSIDELASVVRSSTGLDLFGDLASSTATGKAAVESVLVNLGYQGWHRWFLIGVLALKIDNDYKNADLRRLIFSACPETLMPKRNIDDVLTVAICRLKNMLRISLTEFDKAHIENARRELVSIGRKVERLKSLRILHELFHQFYLLLEYQKDKDLSAAISGVINETKNISASVVFANDKRVDELRWCDEHSLKIGSVIDVAQLQTSVLDRLKKLNEDIFIAAKGLSLALLTESLPGGIQVRVPVIRFNHAIRELKAAMLSRVIVHRIWQEAENQLPIVARDLLTPAERGSGDTWLSLRLQWLSLAMLESDEDQRKIETDIAEIEAGLTVEIDEQEAGRKSLPHAEEVRLNAIEKFNTQKKRSQFKFLEVDKNLGSDYIIVTQKFKQPLTDYVGWI